MKISLRALGGPLFIGLLLLASLSPTAGAHSVTPPTHRGLSPYSGGVLTAMALRNGTLHRPHGSVTHVVNPHLSCSPAPCVLPNVQASTSGSQPVNEDPIVANPKNPNQLLTGGNDYNCPSLQGFYTSNDAGSTWKSYCMNTLSGSSGSGDPGVGYDLNGTAYISGIDQGGPDGADIVFEKSTDNGKTWSAPKVAVKPLLGGLTDKDWLQVDTNAKSPHANAVYISITQFGSNNNSEISVSHTYDGGKTWSTVAVDTQQVYPAIDQFSDLAIGKDGTVYASWMRCTANGSAGDCGGTKATFVVSKSTDGGKTWSAPVTDGTATLAPDACSCAFYGSLPNTSERVSNIPAIDIDNSTGANAGHLYIVNYNWTGKYLKVQVTTSTDGGKTWSKPKRVTPRSDKHDQFLPWLTVSSKGTVGVTWLDRRDDPANLKYAAYAGISTDGGATYKNVKLASALSNPLNDGFGGSFMGDYTGNYWAGNTLFASWMDTRNGTTSQDEVGGYVSA